jgi:hypothetical protein
MPQLPENLDVLRDAAFRRLLGSAAVSWFGDRMVTVALAFAVLEIDRSASAIGIVLATRTGAQLVCLLIGGVVADRVARRPIMVAADVSRLITQGLLAAIVVAGTAEVWSVALLAGLGGAASGFFSPASTGLLPAIVGAGRLQQANGLRAPAMSAGEIGGPVLAGVLVAAVGAGWALAVDAATFGISALLLMGIRVPGSMERAASGFFEDLREGWTTFSRTTWVWTFVLWASLANVTWGAWSVLGPVVADRDLGGAAAWGTVLAAMGVGALAGSLLATQVKPRRPLVFVAVTDGLFALPLAFLAAAPPVPVLACGALVSGAGLMLGMSVWESTLQRHVPGESLSRVSSYDWFGSLAFYPLGLAIWGPLAAVIGISVSLWLAFGLSVAAILALLTVPDVRDLPAEPRRASSPLPVHAR